MNTEKRKVEQEFHFRAIQLSMVKVSPKTPTIVLPDRHEIDFNASQAGRAPLAATPLHPITVKQGKQE